MKTKITTIALAAALGFAGAANGQLLISQYIDTNSGTTPKGIEIWNSSSTAVDFSLTELDILQGTNGGSPVSKATQSTGILAAGDVWVFGTSDIGTYLDTTFGIGSVNFTPVSFQFNGDDSLVLNLNEITLDVFGIPGVDPGSAWSGNGVSTANQNIATLPSITTGTTTGFTDPSTRFQTISTDPSGAGGLAGFGVAPVPEPSAYALLAGLLGLGYVMVRRRRA